MDIFGIDPENLNKIDIHNFEKSRRNKNLKNVVFSSKMLDDRVWALISPTIKKLETLVLQMLVTATHTSQCVSLAAICWKTPELWVVKNRFFSHFFSGFSAIYFHLYLSLVEYDFSGFQQEGSICYRFWEFARNRFLKSFQKSVQSDPYEKHSALSSG